MIRGRAFAREPIEDRSPVVHAAATLGALALTLALAAAASRASANLNLPHPVMTALPAVETSSVSAHRRVLFVVIDGLRADVARTLPFLNQLARAGARVQLWADPPTSSTAQYVALLAGVPPRDSGVRRNDTIRPAGVDDVGRRAREAGLRTAVVSTMVDWWERLFPDSFQDARVVVSERLLAEAGQMMQTADFFIVHLVDVDEAGHAAGAQSPAYAEAARAADRMTETLARAWGWPAADVVVTADHGHRARGGHGGDEPDVRESFLVAAGPDVAPAPAAEAGRSIDLAPTLAALLGIPAPANASGRTRVDLLRLSPPQRAALVQADAQRLTQVAAATLDARRVAARDEVRGRWLRGIPAILLLALAIARFRRAPHAIARGLVGVALAIGCALLIFGPISLSAFRRMPVWIASIAFIGFVAAGLALAAGRRRREGIRGVMAVIAAFTPPALVAFVYAGMFSPRLTCEPAWVAAGPLFAYALLGGACAAATLAFLGEQATAIRTRAASARPARPAA